MDNFLPTDGTEQDINQETGLPHHMGLHMHDLSEGSEFLTDEIRMTEQPPHFKQSE